MNENFDQIIDMNQLTASSIAVRSIYELSQGIESVIKVAVLRADGQWHSHEKEAEMFYVVAGILWLDMESAEIKTVELRPGQAYMVPPNVKHRARTPEQVTLLLVEHTV